LFLLLSTRAAFQYSLPVLKIYDILRAQIFSIGRVLAEYRNAASVFYAMKEVIEGGH